MKHISRYTLRIPSTLYQKLKHTASLNSRSRNKEIEMAIKRYINDFERLNGEISVAEKLND